MKSKLPTSKQRRWMALLVAFVLAMSACSSSDDSSSGSADASSSDSGDSGGASAAPLNADMVQAPGECGLGTGEPATGEPILLGGLATNVPGVDFTWIPKMASIYFDCVNENGGINGRPIHYSFEDAAPDPAVLAALATKLVEEDGVLGIVGNTELLECDINGDYYDSKGFHPIIAGVAPGCFLSPQWSAVNMGPYYSNLGAAQTAQRMGAEGTMVVASPNQPGMDFNNTSVVDFAAENGYESVSILEDVPIADPAGFAQRLVQEAGEGGAVVLNFTGPTVTPLLQAIESQGLIDSVIWASATPPNDPSVAAALGSDWDGKFFINAEFNVLDSGLPDNDHMLELHSAAGADFPISSFSQMGYLVGRITTEALFDVEGDMTVESVNGAIVGLSNFESDMFCKPWYYTNGSSANVSNNTDRTVVPEGDNMVLIEDCFDVAALETNPLGEIRSNE